MESKEKKSPSAWLSEFIVVVFFKPLLAFWGGWLSAWTLTWWGGEHVVSITQKLAGISLETSDIPNAVGLLALVGVLLFKSNRYLVKIED